MEDGGIRMGCGIWEGGEGGGLEKYAVVLVLDLLSYLITTIRHDFPFAVRGRYGTLKQ